MEDDALTDMRTVRRMEQEALAGMRLALVVGPILVLAGFALLSVTWPNDGGNWLWAIVAGLVLMTGNALYWVAIIGYGVGLGRRSTASATR